MSQTYKQFTMLIQFIKLYKVLSDIIKSGNNPFDVDYWTPMYFHPYTTYVEGEWMSIFMGRLQKVLHAWSK